MVEQGNLSNGPAAMQYIRQQLGTQNGTGSDGQEQSSVNDPGAFNRNELILSQGLDHVDKKTNRVGYLAGGAAILGVIGTALGGAALYQNFTQDKDIRNNTARIEMPADSMLIRNYALKDGAQTCKDAPSWTPVGKDCKYNVDLGTSGTHRYDGFLGALSELDMKSGYKLEDAVFKIDHSRHAIPISDSTKPLENLLTGLFGDTANDNGVIYWQTNPNAPTVKSSSRTLRRATQTCGGSDIVYFTGDGETQSRLIADCGGGQLSIPGGWCTGSNEKRASQPSFYGLGNGKVDGYVWSCTQTPVKERPGGDGEVGVSTGGGRGVNGESSTGHGVSEG